MLEHSYALRSGDAHKQGIEFLAHKAARALVWKDRFVVGAMGSSVTAGHDNCNYDSYEKQLHRTIAKVGEDVERLAFNTAIASMIEFVNAALKTGVTQDQMDRFVRVLAPFAPHFAEELWHKLGHEDSVALAAWPGYEESMLVDDEVEIAVQILGKVKARLSVPAGASQDELKELALKDETIAQQIAGKNVRKVIVVPGRLVNIVTG